MSDSASPNGGPSCEGPCPPFVNDLPHPPWTPARALSPLRLRGAPTRGAAWGCVDNGLRGAAWACLGLRGTWGCLGLRGSAFGFVRLRALRRCDSEWGGQSGCGRVRPDGAGMLRGAAVQLDTAGDRPGLRSGSRQGALLDAAGLSGMLQCGAAAGRGERVRKLPGGGKGGWCYGLPVAVACSIP
eukprot:scaffold184524_cov34-Tisochrysis_lutea.AAC.4